MVPLTRRFSASVRRAGSNVGAPVVLVRQIDTATEATVTRVLSRRRVVRTSPNIEPCLARLVVVPAGLRYIERRSKLQQA